LREPDVVPPVIATGVLAELSTIEAVELVTKSTVEVSGVGFVGVGTDKV
jgi:hypothetical protein